MSFLFTTSEPALPSAAGSRGHASYCAPDLLFVPLLALLLGLIAIMPLRANYDTAFYLYTGRLLLEGKLLYVDWLDINPPLASYLSVIPNLAARALHIHVIPTFSLLVFGLVAWSSLSIRKRLLSDAVGADRASAAAILICWVLYSFYVYQENDFGQRDHLCVLLFAPYFVFRWVRWETGEGSPTIGAALGFVAAVGVCLKPYFLLLPIFCESYWLLRHRTLRPLFQAETAVFVVTGLAYAAHFLFLPEAMKTELWNYIIPSVFSSYTKLGRQLTYIGLLNHNGIFAAVLAMVLPFVVRPRKAGALWGLAQSATMIIAAGLGVYMLHSKGFTHHFDIMFGGMALVVGVALAESKLLRASDSRDAGERFTLRTTRGWVCALMGLLIVGITAAGAVRWIVRPPASYTSEPFTKIVLKHSQTGESILVIAADMGVIWPSLLQMDRRQASRYAAFAGFPMMYVGEARDTNGALNYHTVNTPKDEARFLRELEEDIERYKPRLIVLHDPSTCFTCPEGFRMKGYLEAMGVFDRSMRDYTKVDTIGDFSAYVRTSRVK